MTLYYSDAETFNIHSAESVSTSVFDYNSSFSIVVSGLKSGTTYTYCLSVKVKGEEVYGDIMKFKTEDKPTLVTSFEIGTIVPNSGYYYHDIHINGFALPLYKEDIPDKIDYVRFYLRGMEEDDIRNVTVEVGYFTEVDIKSPKSFIPVKTATVPVTFSTNFTLTDLPIECTKNEIESAMASSPDAKYWGVAYYLSAEYEAADLAGEGYNYSIGAGYYRDDEKYSQLGNIGLYRYKNNWYVRSGSPGTAIYTGTVTVIPPEK